MLYNVKNVHFDCARRKGVLMNVTLKDLKNGCKYVKFCISSNRMFGHESASRDKS